MKMTSPILFQELGLAKGVEAQTSMPPNCLPLVQGGWLVSVEQLQC